MKYQKSSIGIAALVALIVGISLYSAFKRPSTHSNRQFIVGTASGYAPFVSINQKGDYEGFDIDIAHALAKQLEKELIIKDLGSMTSLFMALNQGTIDAIIWGVSITADRLKVADLIHYQGASTKTYPLLFWKTIPDTIRSINDMTSKIICVEPTSSQDAVLSKYPLITILPTEKVDDALLNIQYGKADAAFVEPAIAKKFKNKFPEIRTLDVPLALEDQVEGIGIVLKKNSDALKSQVQDAVNALKADGTIAKLEQKWDIPS